MAKEATTIDKDLADGLQQARKKKPRYFAVIAKGPDVVGMIVQKKVINAGLVQKAKAEAKGNLIIEGVCRGEGVELIFEVVGEEPSILPKKIKDFIAERTELTLKAQWSVVPQLTAVVDEEAVPPADAAPPPEPSAAAAAPPIPPPPPPPAQPATAATALDAKSLQARLMALVLRQKAVVAKTPAVRDFLNTITKPTADLITKVSPESPAALDKLDQALTGAEQWSTELTRVEPLYQQFLETNPPSAAKIRDVMAFCQQQAATGAYDKALAGLQKLGPLLQVSGTSAAPSEAPATPLQPPSDASAAPTADWKTARQAWQDANDDVNDQINGLRRALLDRVKKPDDEDEGMEGLAEALSEIAEQGLNAVTEDHRVKLMASVMEVGDGSPAAMQKFGAKALGLITGFQEFLATSEKIEVCDGNPFDAPVSIRATLTPPLAQMAAAIQASIT
jgi:hypothetical protein